MSQKTLRLFQDLSHAHDVLKDPEKRRAYEIYGRDRSKTATSTSEPSVNSKSTEGEPQRYSEEGPYKFKNYDEFIGHLQKMYDTAVTHNNFTIQALTSYYLAQRSKLGPVDAFLKFMNDWFPQRGLWELNHESTKHGKLFLDFFYDDFVSNQPDAKQYWELYGILQRYPWAMKLRDQTLSDSLKNSKTFQEALGYATGSKLFHLHSGMSVSDIIRNLNAQFSIDSGEVLSKMFSMLVATSWAKDDIKADIYANIIENLSELNTAQALGRLVSLTIDFKLSDKLTDKVENNVYYMINKQPDLLNQLRMTKSDLGTKAAEIFKRKGADAKDSEDLWKRVNNIIKNRD